MKTVLKYFRPYIPRMALQLFIKFLGTITELFIPLILSYILDNIIPLEDESLIFFWGGIMLLCAISVMVFNIIANPMAARISRDAIIRIRHDLFKSISYLDCAEADRLTTSSLVSRLSSDSYNIHQMSSMMQRMGVRAPILVIGGITLTLFLEPVMTSVMVITLPLLGLLVYNISKRGIPMYTKVQQSVDKMVSRVQETMTGVRVIKALSKGKYEQDRFDEASREVVKCDRKASLIMGLTSPCMHLIMNLGLCAVIITGAYRVNIGVTKPGTLIAFMSYFTMILTAMMAVTRMFIMYSKGAASARRIAEVLNCKNSIETVYGDNQNQSDTNDSQIEFKNVSFSYNKVSNNVENISFNLKKGESLGIFGPTGCGKSTIVSLLLRFYDADSGEIFIDGKDIKSYPQKQLRQKFGVAFQNDFLFADTIGENISFGRDLTNQQIQNATKLACAEYIREKEGQYNHQLTVKGANLSGGQKQRLLIARAVACKPDILILDDSQSALDYKTDAQLRKNIAMQTKSMTSIIISSRISSIMNCTKIMVMENGRILGLGTHKELYEALPQYKEISDIQLGSLFDGSKEGRAI